MQTIPARHLKEASAANDDSDTPTDASHNNRRDEKRQATPRAKELRRTCPNYMAGFGHIANGMNKRSMQRDCYKCKHALNQVVRTTKGCAICRTSKGDPVPLCTDVKRGCFYAHVAYGLPAFNSYAKCPNTYAELLLLHRKHHILGAAENRVHGITSAGATAKNVLH